MQGGTENVQVDVYEDNGRYIGSTIYNGVAGETIRTIGTADQPNFYAYNG